MPTSRRLLVAGLVRYTEGETRPGDLTPAAPDPVEEPAEEVEPWDGTIDDDEVYDTDTGDIVHDWDNWDSDGAHYPQRGYITSGSYDPPDGSDPVDVYRWEHHNDNGIEHTGDWDTDRRQVETDLDRHRRRDHEDPPEPTDGDIPRRLRVTDTGDIGTFTDQNGVDQPVYLDTSSFEFAGADFDVYRWRSEDGNVGVWTLNREDARNDGQQHIDDNHHDTPTGKIHGYSYKPATQFHGDKGPYYGVELETQLKDSSPLDLRDAAVHVLDTLNDVYPNEGFAYLKEDSSIEAGSPHRGKGTFEIVTHPATLETHREQWGPLFDRPRRG